MYYVIQVKTGKEQQAIDDILKNKPDDASFDVFAPYRKSFRKYKGVMREVVERCFMVGSCIDDLLEKYPDRVFDVGISEEHGAVFAAAVGLNKDIHAYYSIYSTFLQRSYDEISHDVARLDSDVTFLIDRAGLPGEDGETHSGIYDVAYLMSIPNIAICMASNMEEAIDLFNFSTDYHHPLAIRYPKE